jgi:hypothetical protein
MEASTTRAKREYILAFKINIKADTKAADSVILELVGQLMGEEESPIPHVELSAKKRYTLELQNFKAINSMGIRSFVEWMKSFSGIPLNLVSCPKFFVDQINMIVGLLPPHARIESFYVPYYSENQDEEQSVLYRLGTEYYLEGDQVKLSHPQIVADSKGEAMEVDVIPDRYFKFLDKYAQGMR